MISIAEALKAVEESGKYKILKELPEFTNTIEGDYHTGLYLDTETTGLDTSKDEIIEFGAIPFKFNDSGIEAMEPIHCYNEPRKTITEEITKITGITPEMVKGHTLDTHRIEEVLANIDIVIAHNSAYDRPIVERYIKSFEDKYWGCSLTQVPWNLATTKLEFILYSMGYFYKAHNAISDCRAGLFAISQFGLQHILEASRKTTWHVWAIGADYNVKDLLKERKYYWDADRKVWHKQDVEDAAAEEEWLRSSIYRGRYHARFDKTTGKNRFSGRT